MMVVRNMLKLMLVFKNSQKPTHLLNQELESAPVVEHAHLVIMLMIVVIMVIMLMIIVIMVIMVPWS